MSDFVLRFRGAVSSLGAEGRAVLLERGTSDDDVLRDTVSATIDVVRREGDAALKSLAREYDKAKLTRLDIPRAKWTAALEQLDPRVRAAMERAARNIETAHRAFLPQATEVETEPGIVIGRRPDPLGRVGVYAPGGRAAYPSSVLMGAIPARVAGVKEVIVCSPPNSSGSPTAEVLAACAIAGVDRVFALGGAGAIAAMAYGTESVPRVDRIVGPGNTWVTEAKVQVAKVCAI
ncbi:MAG: histidinol dehydrogenase, partial [Gemmatimonadaceae bacterium]